MKIPLVLTVACLPCAFLHAQNPAPAPKEQKSLERTIRVIIAGQRAMPEFEKKGDQYVEVEPSAKWIVPTALEVIGARESAPRNPGDSKETKTTVWPNEVVELGRYHCASSLRLRLIRTLAKQSPTPPEVDCDLGDVIEPLVVISAGNGGKGWDSPQVKVIDLSAGKVPSRSVVTFNLTNIPLVTRFESEAGQLAPSSVRIMQLPASESDTFRFRIDAQSSAAMVPLANSSYRIGKKDRLILLAIPNTQVAPGAPPLSLQMVLYPSAS